MPVNPDVGEGLGLENLSFVECQFHPAWRVWSRGLVTRVWTPHLVIPVSRRPNSEPISRHLYMVQKTRDFHPLLLQCWASVADGSLTFCQHWLKVSFLLESGFIIFFTMSKLITVKVVMLLCPWRWIDDTMDSMVPAHLCLGRHHADSAGYLRIHV